MAVKSVSIRIEQEMLDKIKQSYPCFDKKRN